MKKAIGISFALAALALPGTALADSETLLSNPGQAQDAKAFCVTNHGTLNGPGAIGEASSARKGENAAIYRNGGVAQQVCGPISQG